MEYQVANSQRFIPPSCSEKEKEEEEASELIQGWGGNSWERKERQCYQTDQQQSSA